MPTQPAHARVGTQARQQPRRLHDSCKQRCSRGACTRGGLHHEGTLGATTGCLTSSAHRAGLQGHAWAAARRTPSARTGVQGRAWTAAARRAPSAATVLQGQLLKTHLGVVAQQQPAAHHLLAALHLHLLLGAQRQQQVICRAGQGRAGQGRAGSVAGDDVAAGAQRCPAHVSAARAVAPAVQPGSACTPPLLLGSGQPQSTRPATAHSMPASRCWPRRPGWLPECRRAHLLTQSCRPRPPP